MSNNHIHPIMARALSPFVPPPNYSVSVRHLKGERGCVLRAEDRQDAAIKGISMVALRQDEIPLDGVDLMVTKLIERVSK